MYGSGVSVEHFGRVGDGFERRIVPVGVVLETRGHLGFSHVDDVSSRRGFGVGDVGIVLRRRRRRRCSGESAESQKEKKHKRGRHNGHSVQSEISVTVYSSLPVFRRE